MGPEHIHDIARSLQRGNRQAPASPTMSPTALVRVALLAAAAWSVAASPARSAYSKPQYYRAPSSSTPQAPAASPAPNEFRKVFNVTEAEMIKTAREQIRLIIHSVRAPPACAAGATPSFFCRAPPRLLSPLYRGLVSCAYPIFSCAYRHAPHRLCRYIFPQRQLTLTHPALSCRHQAHLR